MLCRFVNTFPNVCKIILHEKWTKCQKTKAIFYFKFVHRQEIRFVSNDPSEMTHLLGPPGTEVPLSFFCRHLSFPCCLRLALERWSQFFWLIAIYWSRGIGSPINNPPVGQLPAIFVFIALSVTAVISVGNTWNPSWVIGLFSILSSLLVYSVSHKLTKV